MKNSNSSATSTKPKSRSQLTDTKPYIASAQAAKTALDSLSSQCATWEATTAAQTTSSNKELYKLLGDCNSTVDAALADATFAVANTVKAQCDKLAGKLTGKTPAERLTAAVLHIAFPRTRGEDSSNKQRKSQYKTAVMAARKHRGSADVATWIENAGGLERIRRTYTPQGDIREPRKSGDKDCYFGAEDIGTVTGSVALEASFGHQYSIHIVEYDKDTDTGIVRKVTTDPKALEYLDRHFKVKRPPADTSTLKLKDLKTMEASNDPQSKVVA